jgi:hypothetical protein
MSKLDQLVVYMHPFNCRQIAISNNVTSLSTHFSTSLVVALFSSMLPELFAASSLISPWCSYHEKLFLEPELADLLPTFG